MKFYNLCKNVFRYTPRLELPPDAFEELRRFACCIHDGTAIAISGYGYGGPVVNAAGESPQFLEGVWRQFEAWGITENIFAEVVKFHSLLDNKHLAPQGKLIRSKRTTGGVHAHS